jgi:hypothetical protein
VLECIASTPAGALALASRPGLLPALAEAIAGGGRATALMAPEHRGRVLAAQRSLSVLREACGTLHAQWARGGGGSSGGGGSGGGGSGGADASAAQSGLPADARAEEASAAAAPLAKILQQARWGSGR